MDATHGDSPNDLTTLARTAAEGDGRAAHAILDAIQDDVYRMALRMLGHRADAEDATQEILLIVLTHLGSFRGESGLKTWVWKINIARGLNVHTLATTRSRERFKLVHALGTEAWVDTPDLSKGVRAQRPQGIDAVLDLVGTTTLVDSLKMARYGGRVAMAGFSRGARAARSVRPAASLPQRRSAQFLRERLSVWHRRYTPL